MGRSVEGLTPADLMLRAMVLEGRGKPREASVWAERAREGLYTTEYRNALESQLACVARRVRGSVTPVVDLASGRGVLVERLLAEGGTVLATDVSPRVLRWTLRRLRSRARPHRLAGAALDARQLPFRDGSVPTMTTLLGLQNIDAPGPLLRELRRVVSGRLLAVCQFLAPGDEPNRRSLRERGVEALFLRSRCEAAFRAAGWRAEVENLVTAQARPTPTSSVLPGVGIDGFPVAPTELEWGVLVAR
jgi:SAM-dependent methyltransferase